MSIGAHYDRNQESTVWIGGLDPAVTEELLFELLVHAGPIVNVNIPKDKITGMSQPFAFCEFENVVDADYCARIMNNIRLYGKYLKINKAAKDGGSGEEVAWQAKLFVGNLDMSVDEKLLHDTFSTFGYVLSCKVMTEEETGKSKGFGFINFDSFESADAAIEAMNGQYLCNRAISVTYAYKKETKGERHGNAAERLLAKQAGAGKLRPAGASNIGFSALPGAVGGGMARPPPPSAAALAAAGRGAMGMGRPYPMAPPGGFGGPPPPPMMNGGPGAPPPFRGPPPPQQPWGMGRGAPTYPPPPAAAASHPTPPPPFPSSSPPPPHPATQQPPTAPTQPPGQPTYPYAQAPPPWGMPPGMPPGMPSSAYPPMPGMGRGMGMPMPGYPPMSMPPMGYPGGPPGGIPGYPPHQYPPQQR